MAEWTWGEFLEWLLGCCCRGDLPEGHCESGLVLTTFPGEAVVRLDSQRVVRAQLARGSHPRPGQRVRVCADGVHVAERPTPGQRRTGGGSVGTPGVPPQRLTLAPLRDLGHTMTADTGANTRRNPNRGSVTAWHWSSASRTRSVPRRQAITDALVAELLEAGEPLAVEGTVTEAVPVASAPLPWGVLTLWQAGSILNGQLIGRLNAYALTTWNPVTDILTVIDTKAVTPPVPLGGDAMTAGGWRAAPQSGFQAEVYSTDPRLNTVGPYFYTSWMDVNPALYAARHVLPEEPLILTDAGTIRQYTWARFEGGTANVTEDGDLDGVTSWYGIEGTFILTATTAGIDVQWEEGPIVTPRLTSTWVNSGFQDGLLTTGGGRGDGAPLLILVTRTGSTLGDAHLLSVNPGTGALTLRKTVPEVDAPFWASPPGNDARYDLDVNIDALTLNFTPAPPPVNVGPVTVKGVTALAGRLRLLLPDAHPLRDSDTLTLPSGVTAFIVGASRGAVDVQDDGLPPEDRPRAGDAVSTSRQPVTSLPGGPGRTRLTWLNEAVVLAPDTVSGWTGTLKPNSAPDAPTPLLRRAQLLARRPTPVSAVPPLTATFPALPAGWRWADVTLLLTFRTPKPTDLIVTASGVPPLLLTLPRSGRHWLQRRVTLTVPADHTGPLTVTLTPDEPLDLSQLALEAVQAQ